MKRKRNTDDVLRTLEREARSGDPQARARLIAGQLRAGLLTHARVEIASWLGDPIAQLVVAPPVFQRSAWVGPHPVSSLNTMLTAGRDMPAWLRWSNEVPTDLWLEYGLRGAEILTTASPAPGEPPVRPEELPPRCADGLAAVRRLVGPGIRMSELAKVAEQVHEVEQAVWDGELAATSWDDHAISAVSNLIFASLWLNGWTGENGSDSETPRSNVQHGVALALQVTGELERYVDDNVNGLRQMLVDLLLDPSAPHIRSTILPERPRKKRTRNPLVDSDVLAQRLYDASPFEPIEIPLSKINMSTSDRGHPVVDEPELYRFFLIPKFPVNAFGLRVEDVTRDGDHIFHDDLRRHDKIVELLREGPAWPAIVTATGVLVDGFHRVAANRTLRRKTMPVIVAVERSRRDHWDDMWLGDEEARRNPDADMRALERAAAAGDPEAQSRLVLARIRAGQRWDVTDEDIQALGRGSDMEEHEVLTIFRGAGLIQGAEEPMTLSGDKIIGAFVGLHLGRGAGFYSSGRRGAHVNSFWVRPASEVADPTSVTRAILPRGRLRDLDLERAAVPPGLREQVAELAEERPVIVHRVAYFPRGDDMRVLGWVVTSRGRRVLWIAQAGSSSTERSRATVRAVARTVGWDRPGGWLGEQCACGHEPDAHGEERGVCQYCRGCNRYRSSQ